MNSVVYVPFVASALIACLCRVASSRRWPLAAAYTITAAAVIGAVSTVGALVLLASPLPARVPWIASLGRWQPGAVVAHSPVAAWTSALAMAALVVLAHRTLLEVRALVQDAIDASRLAATICGSQRDADADADAVVVVGDEVPHAHAVGFGIRDRGRVIVSSAMLLLLDHEERAAMIAHERAHLRERHAVLLAVVRVATAMNPLLHGLRADVRFALERSADEAAARATDRPVVASAVARAALAVIDVGRHAPHALAFHPHGVADRVSALLAEPDRRRRPSWPLVAVLVIAALAFAWATHDTERFFEAVRRLSHR